MLRIAVTGNIGSGKSVVCRVFQNLGIPVFYADKEAKQLYNDPDVLQQMTDRFGEKILNNNKQLDTKALAAIIFNNREDLDFVNHIIHPRVFSLFEKWVEGLDSSIPYCIQEAALTFESGSQHRFSKIIVVHAPEEILLQRTMKRDNTTLQQARQRLSNQAGQQWKMDQADFLIQNDGTTPILPQILQIHNKLTTPSLPTND
ncbi:MAG: dephospho-CoA kinase [Bacteroidota bacterium]